MLFEKPKKIFYILLATIYSFPLLSEAQVFQQSSGGRRSFSWLVGNIISIINGFIYLTMALATIYFLFGILRYMTQYGDEKVRAESVKTISYGLMSLFIMVSIWGIIAILQTSLLGGGIGIPQF